MLKILIISPAEIIAFRESLRSAGRLIKFDVSGRLGPGNRAKATFRSAPIPIRLERFPAFQASGSTGGRDFNPFPFWSPMATFSDHGFTQVRESEEDIPV